MKTFTGLFTGIAGAIATLFGYFWLEFGSGLLPLDAGCRDAAGYTVSCWWVFPLHTVVLVTAVVICTIFVCLIMHTIDEWSRS